MITRSDLVRRLAEVSHETYIRQRVRDKGESRDAVLAEVGVDPTDHDRERAEDVVRELERLDLLESFDHAS
jgi:hypothetical protein